MPSHKGILKNTNKYNSVSHNHLDYRSIYRVWNTMIRRCTNPKCDMYYCYGGRGIKVCERWVDKNVGFINFYNDMGKRPVDERGRPYQIDRIDVNGDYCPDNCRWVSAKDNSSNRRNTIKISLFGDTMCLTEACRLLHINRSTVTENIRLRQMTLEDSFIHGLKVKYKGAML